MSTSENPPPLPSDSQSQEDQPQQTNPNENNYPNEEEEEDKLSSSSSSDSDSDTDSDSDSDYEYAPEGDTVVPYTRPGNEPPPADNSPEANIERFTRVLESKSMKRMQEEEDKDYVYTEDIWDFPEDRENWKEEDLQELWADAPLEMTKPGWDPVWADEEDWDIVREEIKAGRDPPIAPFYLPYRKPFPVIPDNHFDISNPKAVIEELDRTEEFLTWVSYIFPDGSSYEGTVWDDLAHGKGVYVAEQGLVKYEGEWLQNNMEGHGVVEVDIPDIEPVPNSKLETKMRAEGKIIARDYMSSEDREWLEKDIEDSMLLARGNYEIPFYERDEWVRQFGRKPEKGRYKYAGQWKHGRMHGCGVYEMNERVLYGKFYFGEFVDEATECDEDISALHAGIAEVAAAKARMFVNKPDGMIREQRGPYSDPQHPYFYEEEDVWMAPGFINQFYEVPDYWKRYVHEVDQEREMWLNSFYKAPLRLPMPAELEYWWSKDEEPEFVLINKEPEPDPHDPSKLLYNEDPLILHTPTGRIINYVEDEEHGIRLFWQPYLEEGEDVDPEKAEFLPLGFDDFYGKEEVVMKKTMLQRLLNAVENTCKPVIEKIQKWAAETKEVSEIKLDLMNKELELIEAELSLEEAIEDVDEELKTSEEEEEKVGMDLKEEETPALPNQDKKPSAEDEKPSAEQADEKEDEEEDEEEEEEEDAPSSFGSVDQNDDSSKNGGSGYKPGKSPFSASSLSFASCSLLNIVPSGVQQSFSAWKDRLLPIPHSSHLNHHVDSPRMVSSVSFPRIIGQEGRIRAQGRVNLKLHARGRTSATMSQLYSLSRILSHPSDSLNPKRNRKMPRKQGIPWLHNLPERDSDSVLSLHMLLDDSKPHKTSTVLPSLQNCEFL